MRNKITIAMGILFLSAVHFISDSYMPIESLDSFRPWFGSFIAYAFVLLLAVLVAQSFLNHRAKLFLSLGSIVMALLIGEVLLRLFFPLQSLPSSSFGIRSQKLHHTNIPNATFYHGNFEGTDVTVSLNEDGLRTAYSRDAFLKYDHRLAVMGDSFVFGFGVAENQTFVHFLESKLRSQNPSSHLAVLNAGITSHSPFLSEHLYDEVVQHYKPQLVIYLLDPTDIGDDYRYRSEALFQEDGNFYFPWNDDIPAPFYGPVHQLLSRCFVPFSEALRYPIKEFRSDGARKYDYKEFEVKIGDTVETNRFFIYRHPLESTRPYFEVTLANIRRLAKRVDNFLLVVSPRYHHWDDQEKECPDNWEKSLYGLSEKYQYEYFRFFEEVAGTLSFPVVQLLPYFKQAKDYPLVFKGDPHWTEKGHRTASNALLDVLSKEFPNTPNF